MTAPVALYLPLWQVGRDGLPQIKVQGPDSQEVQPNLDQVTSVFINTGIASVKVIGVFWGTSRGIRTRETQGLWVTGGLGGVRVKIYYNSTGKIK